MDGKHKVSVATTFGNKAVWDEAGIENMGDTEYAKALAEATGIEYEFTHIEPTAEAAALYIAEGKYADILEWPKSFFPGRKRSCC